MLEGWSNLVGRSIILSCHGSIPKNPESLMATGMSMVLRNWIMVLRNWIITPILPRTNPDDSGWDFVTINPTRNREETGFLGDGGISKVVC